MRPRHDELLVEICSWRKSEQYPCREGIAHNFLIKPNNNTLFFGQLATLLLFFRALLPVSRSGNLDEWLTSMLLPRSDAVASSWVVIGTATSCVGHSKKKARVTWHRALLNNSQK